VEGCQAFVLEHDSCRSSETKRQMKTAFWQASITPSQAREYSQTNGFEHTIEQLGCTTPPPQEGIHWTRARTAARSCRANNSKATREEAGPPAGHRGDPEHTTGAGPVQRGPAPTRRPRSGSAPLPPVADRYLHELEAGGAGHSRSQPDYGHRRAATRPWSNGDSEPTDRPARGGRDSSPAAQPRAA
jgi:hypothetical protein